MKKKDKLLRLREILEFYANNSYVSTPHEYYKDTRYNSGYEGNERFPNRVGLYGTKAKEGLIIIQTLLNEE